MVKLISGANEVNADLEGKTIGEIRDQFGTALNLNGASRVTVNGLAADDSYEVASGDRVTFSRETGQKG